MSSIKINHIEGKDSAGNYAYVSVYKERGKIILCSSEECGDVVFTKSQARELIKCLEECINQ
ncbi:MAG: hypothetical protein IJZ79_03660 [Bacilli bacterium]|nr:hypothetical protein [Bacilli bacterium]MBQ8218826.1 hypothetical protein [Bacilli bacterium]